VFSVVTYEKGKDLVVVGEVDQQEAKSELLEKLKELYPSVIDSVTVLPAKELGEKIWAIVNVSVANMRSEPAESAELGSQVLMGNVVRVLKKKGGWAYIQSPDKYLGWVDTDQIVVVNERTVEDWNGISAVFVTGMNGTIYEGMTTSSMPVSDVTAGAVLKRIGGTEEWTVVALADSRRGYIRTDMLIEKRHWGTVLVPIPDTVVKTGKLLKGVPYLWGGTSPKGVDCSGFTRTVYLLNGVLLNRDANQQAEQGQPVEPGKDFENLKKGDLLFFGRAAGNGKPERIVHVGIYIGNKRYIHSSGMVRINSFDEAEKDFNKYNLERFVRARRIITSTPHVTEMKVQ
ncbi:MAG: C40 family peptidase, partial [Bacteroidetes bacterium]|nr:C40 family peptidase [Bacteroidota bacterium]